MSEEREQPTVRLGEARMPALGLGTWQLKGDVCREAVEHGLELGYRHVDTAQIYGNEAEVGAALAASGLDRGAVWVTTKLWTVDETSTAALVASLDASLERLGTDYVDQLLIHWPPPEQPLSVAVDALAEIEGTGKARTLGVSNFPPSLWEEALARVPAVCNQVEYHPYLGQARLLEMARERGLAVTAYSPVAQGKVARDPTLTAIGERHGRTPFQVAVRWLIQQVGVAAVPRSSKAAHRESNLGALDFELTPAEMDEIFALDRGERLIDPSFGPTWER